ISMLTVMLLTWQLVVGIEMQTDVVYLTEGNNKDITGNSYGNNMLRIFCYVSKASTLLSLFETNEFRLLIESEDFQQYDGYSPDQVRRHYGEKRSLLSLMFYLRNRKVIQLSPFETRCIGIVSRQPYNVSLQHMAFDRWRLLQLSLGLLIIWNAAQLARKSAFYYLLCMLLGICAGIVLLSWYIKRLLPKHSLVIGALLGSWSLGLYILRQLANNYSIILQSYRNYLLGYVLLTGSISLLLCYRFGTPKHPRTQQIIGWLLQALGCLIVYLSSWHTHACIIIMVLSILAYYFTDSLLWWSKLFYRCKFTRPRRLLTKRECFEQMVTETSQALVKLREHVNSPDCKGWHLMTTLRNPSRFAGFATGDPHLYDEEIEDYSRAIDQ
ncbi:CG9723, partial [Drosophila busckii]